MNRIALRAALAALCVVAVPASATAHVTLQPAELPAGEFKRVDVRVPNERDDASTTKVEVKFPPGFIFLSHERVPGWKTTVKMAKLDKPVEVFGEQHDEQVDTVTFAAEEDGVAPGEFQDFGLSVRLPDQAGESLTFKALQTYSSGEVVRWIGAPDSEQPAPQVKLTTAAAGHGAAAGATPAAAAVKGGDDADEDGEGLSLIALIVGALGLLAGVAGLLTARRRPAPASA